MQETVTSNHDDDDNDDDFVDNSSQIIAKPKRAKKTNHKTSAKKLQETTNGQIAEIANSLILLKNEVKKMSNNQQELEKTLKVLLSM